MNNFGSFYVARAPAEFLLDLEGKSLKILEFENIYINEDLVKDGYKYEEKWVDVYSGDTNEMIKMLSIQDWERNECAKSAPENKPDLKMCKELRYKEGDLYC